MSAETGPSPLDGMSIGQRDDRVSRGLRSHGTASAACLLLSGNEKATVPPPGLGQSGSLARLAGGTKNELLLPVDQMQDLAQILRPRGGMQ